jgi:NitT/TauT family transport system permease protein
MSASTEPARPRRSRSGRVVRGFAGLAAFLLAFEVLGRAGLVSRDYLPPASTILLRAARQLGEVHFLTSVAATIEAWAVGLLIATVVGVPLGLLLGSVPGVNVAAGAVVEFLRPIPSVALIPLAGLLLGSGLQMKATMIVYAALWPVLFNTIYGLADTDPVAKDTLRSFGFGRLAILWRVDLPSAAPFIATGVRLASAVALILAISVEMLNGMGTGLGMYISEARTGTGSAVTVLACTFWAGAIGLALNALFVAIDRRVFAWHRARTGATT